MLIMADAKEVLQALDDENINYQVINHPAVYTAEEADKYVAGYHFIRAKNLFLHSKDGYFLVILPDNQRLDMKLLGKTLVTHRLSFAPESSMQTKLGITAGAISPFNLMNNQEHDVTVVVDEKIAHSQQQIGCHPNDNTKTVILSVQDMLKFIHHCGNPVKILPL